MRVAVTLPDLYISMSGQKKKAAAWKYLKIYYPAYIPIQKQDRLGSDNILICDIDFQKQRLLTAQVNERRAARKSNKKPGGKRS